MIELYKSRGLWSYLIVGNKVGDIWCGVAYSYIYATKGRSWPDPSHSQLGDSFVEFVLPALTLYALLV